jgi:hypothetical protein
MVLHYFDGMQPRQLGIVAVGGGMLAMAATWLWRGNGKGMIDELGLQDSESLLTPTTKSAATKVAQVPHGAGGSGSSGVANAARPVSFTAAAPKAAGSSPFPGTRPPTNAADVGAAVVAAARTSTAGAPETESVAVRVQHGLAATLDAVAHRIGATAQGVVTWTQENPKVTIALIVLTYALQHYLRRNIAHEHYEQAHRHHHNHNHHHHRRHERHEHQGGHSDPPSPVSTTATASPADSLTAGADDPAKVAAAPSSTWAPRARRVNDDPEYAKLLQRLPAAAIAELAQANGINPTRHRDLVERVLNEVLSIAPSVGWRAVERSSGDAGGGGRVRFVDGAGKEHACHPDAEFALDLIKREAMRRDAAASVDRALTGDAETSQ